MRRLLLFVPILLLAVAAPATAAPLPPTHPNGVTRAEALQADEGFGQCATATTGVHCKPNDITGSCQNFSSQTTPPASIRVYDPTYTGNALHIRTVAFKTYVADVLPNEWADSWDGDALKAGAVAITSYAWYWATHYGGYVGDNPTATTCFDVTSDENFQVFDFGSDAKNPNSTAKVGQVFPSAIRVNGQVLQASYFSAVRSGYDAGDPKTYDACGQGADGTFLSQSGSQTCNEDNTGNKWPVILRKYYGTNIELASVAQLRTPHDFQFLHRSTPVTFLDGHWTIADGYPTTFTFGAKGHVPLVSTDREGFALATVYSPSSLTFYVATPQGGIARSVRFGARGDVPLTLHWDGLAAPTRLAVFRPSTGTWYVAATSGASVNAQVKYGQQGDVPVPGRWTSAAGDTLAVFRPSTGQWWVRGGSLVTYGQRGDVPVPADYDGDGRTDIAVYRPSTRQFWVRGHAPVTYGNPGDVPVTGDYTGDGKADLAIYRPSTHTYWVRGGTTSVVGAAGQTPVDRAPFRG